MSLLSVIQINIEIMLVVLCIMIWIITTVWAKDTRQTVYHIWGMDLLTVGLLVSDIIAISNRGDVSTKGYYIVRAANFFNFFFLYFIVLYFIYFIEEVFEHPKQGKGRILIAKVFAIVAVGLNFINLFVPVLYSFDEQNQYYRKTGWYVNTSLILVAIILMATLVVELRKEVDHNVFWMILLYDLMPLIASIMQVFIYGIAITNIALGVTQILLFMITYRYQEMKLKEDDTLLAEYNAKLMLTQVQPHFLLNTLSTIQYLCKSDTESAVETISDLGIYLRNNMEFASTKEMIFFEKELSHIEKYVAIEQKRFGERIKIQYDLKEKEFELPALTVQPLIENAIKHGISKRREGGTIQLSTWRSERWIHVLVKDDGVGFDMDAPFPEDRVHLGFSIVKDRLRRQCGGDVIITSEIDKGTCCEIRLPIEFE